MLWKSKLVEGSSQSADQVKADASEKIATQEASRTTLDHVPAHSATQSALETNESAPVTSGTSKKSKNLKGKGVPSSSLLGN